MPTVTETLFTAVICTISQMPTKSPDSQQQPRSPPTAQMPIHSPDAHQQPRYPSKEEM